MIFYFIFSLIILCSLGLGVFLLLRKTPQHTTKLPLDTPEPAEAAPNMSAEQRMPAFIEKLRAREQSMKAGPSDTKKAGFDLQEIRRKEKAAVAEPPKKRKNLA